MATPRLKMPPGTPGGLTPSLKNIIKMIGTSQGDDDMEVTKGTFNVVKRNYERIPEEGIVITRENWALFLETMTNIRGRGLGKPLVDAFRSMTDEEAEMYAALADLNIECNLDDDEAPLFKDWRTNHSNLTFKEYMDYLQMQDQMGLLK